MAIKPIARFELMENSIKPNLLPMHSPTQSINELPSNTFEYKPRNVSMERSTIEASKEESISLLISGRHSNRNSDKSHEE
jgi:hypothetical protein